MAFFRTLVGSFHSRTVYQEARQGNGYWLGYSFWLVALTVGIAALGLVLMVERALFWGTTPQFDDLVHQVTEQLPAMTWHEGRLASETATPITVHVQIDRGAQPPLVMDVLTLDFNGTAGASSMTTPMLLTAQELYIRNNRKTEIHALKEFEEQSQTRIFSKSIIADMGEQLIAFVHQNRAWLYLAATLIGWLGVSLALYVARLLLLCTIALSGVLIGHMTRSPLLFSTAMRLAAVAYTPVAIISCLPIFLGLHVAPVTLFIAGSAMLALAMRITRDTPLAAA